MKDQEFLDFVKDCAVQGFTDKQIAKKLGLDLGTFRTLCVEKKKRIWNAKKETQNEHFTNGN